MASERVKMSIGEICFVRQGRYLAPREMAEFRSAATSVPVYGANGVLGYTDRVMFEEPVSLVTCRGNGCGLLQRTEGRAWISNNAMACPPKGENNSRYLYYLLLSSNFADVTTGSAQAQITASHLNAKSLLLATDPAEQKTIAAVLGALDEKIELNQRMNATLERMTRAVFQSWFVDFDPVRANLDAMPIAGVDKRTSALFPAHFKESPLGKVPVGWRVLRFADVLTSHSARVGEDSIPEFSATVSGLSSRDERFKKQLSKSQSKNKRIVSGDLVFGFSREVINFGLMREPIGAVSPVYEVFKIDASKIEPELLERLFRFNMPYYMDILKPGAREGKPIDRDYLLSKHLLVPDIAVQRAFLATIKPWSDKIKANDSQSRTLAALRDTLLPKLLSGELSVAGV